MSKLLCTFFILFCLLLSGCDPLASNVKPGIEGYVVKKVDGRILVVDPLPQDFSSTGGMKEYYNAIWFSNAPKKVQVGQKVKVWFNIVATSYPGQSSSKKVTILPSNHPTKANLTESEAIRKALTPLVTAADEVLVIKTVEFHKVTGIWNVLIKHGEDEMIVKVEDEKGPF